MATTDKYDRQLRLWGANGQKALSEACVVLFEASAVGTEALKNLVLPGVGSFIIVDPTPATTQDSSANFFVFGSSKLSRAEVATQHLLELNSDVQGSFYTEEEEDGELMERLYKKHGQHLFVLTADLPPPRLLTIATVCNEWSIPLVMMKAYGMIGTVRIQVNHHGIIESKPDFSVPDLRLGLDSSHFPQLHALADSLAGVVDKHTPFVLILLIALKKWRESCSKSSNEFPNTAEEKKAFRDTIRPLSNNYDMELNFQEAFHDAYLAYTVRELPWEVQSLVDKAEETIISRANVNVTKFDILVLALSRYLQQHSLKKLPPLNGSIPDMTSATQPYVALQNVYKNKAEEDCHVMAQHVETIFMELSSSSRFEKLPIITQEDLTQFCKNVYNLRLVQTRPYSSEHYFKYDNEEEELKEELMNVEPYEAEEHTPLLWYIALRACEVFYNDSCDNGNNNGVYPGGREEESERDAKTVQTHIGNIVHKLGLLNSTLIQSTLLNGSNKHAIEMVRYYNAEIHNVASVVGGVASQEMVKLITKQYVPFDGVYVYNGIAGVAGVYKI